MASEDTCSGLAVAGVVGKEIWSWNAALSQYSGCTSLTWLLSSSGQAEKHLNLQSNEKSISLSAKNPALGVPSPVRAARMDKPIRHGRQAHKPQYKPQFSGLYLEQSPSFRSTQIHSGGVEVTFLEWNAAADSDCPTIPFVKWSCIQAFTFRKPSQTQLGFRIQKALINRPFFSGSYLRGHKERKSNRRSPWEWF